jgi:hypothetical protein
MRDYNFLKNKFLEKHTIDNSEFLDKYIKLMIEYKLSESIDYVEKHHILPRSVFPEFENEDWNIIELKYSDHVNAHLYLFKSINIRAYQRPLNWMLKYYKNKEETSNAAKKGWDNLKKDKDKYNLFCLKRSNYMKKLSTKEQTRRANIFWDKISDEEYLKFSNKIKEYWTEDKRIEKSKQMNEYYLDPENVIKKSIETQNRWDSMSGEDRERFNTKMNIVNKDEKKRRVAGDKIKSLWKSEDYLEKMKNRPHRKGTSILIINPNGEQTLVETMKDMERIYGFSSYLVRKYRDTDLEIDDKDLKINKSLLKCKIKTIKNG